MSLSSTSTLTDALAQYNDNLFWDGSATKAQAAIEAVRFILVNRPQRMADGMGKDVNYAELAKEKEKLENFLNRSSSQVNRCSFVRGKMRL